MTAPRNEPNNVYVVEKVGRIRVIVRGRLRARPFLDIRSLVLDNGEQGFLGLAFSPKYAKDRHFYVDYTDRNGDARIVEYNSRGLSRRPKRLRQIFFQDDPYPNHNGGDLIFGPDGYLYTGTGDGGSGGDPENRAQNLGSNFGKMLQVQRRAKAPLPLIVGYGLRNPWRFSFDRQTGDLYIGDVGQDSWEELDFTQRGTSGLENYGWRVYEGKSRYTPSQSPNAAGHLVFPYIVMPNGPYCSVIGGFVYRGQRGSGGEGPVLLRRQLREPDPQHARGRERHVRARSRSRSTGSRRSARTRAASSTSPPCRAGTSTRLRVELRPAVEPSRAAERSRRLCWPSAAYASACSDSLSARISWTIGREVLARVEAPVQGVDFRVQPVEALEQRVELAIGDFVLLHRVNCKGRADRVPDDERLRAEPLEQAIERSGSRLERLDSAVGSELGDRDSRQCLGRVGEHAEPVAARGERSERGADLRVGPQVDRRAVLREAAKGGPPVADPVLGPRVELLRRLDAILGKRGRIQRRDRMEPPRRVGEPVAPERPRVAEHVQLDRDWLHRPCPVPGTGRVWKRRLTRKIPSATPTASMRTSTGDACRPATKCWCTSSVVA